MIQRLLHITFISSILFGQYGNNQIITKSGTTVAQFLKIGVDARSTGMGNAGVGLTSNLSSMFWNPAGLASIQGIGIQFGNHDWLATMKHQHIFTGISLQGAGVLGFGVISLSSPEDLVRTVVKPEGTGEKFSTNDLAVNLSYARSLTDKFSLGGTIKYIQQNIWHATASTFAGDIGALFTTPFKGVRLGASISNYGGKMKLEGRDQKISVDPDPGNEGNVEFINANLETESFPIPLFLRVGISGEFINSNSLKLTYGFDALHPNDNSEYVNMGMEAVFNNLVSVRTGIPSLFKEESIEGPTFGVGLDYRIWRTATILKLDYSISDFGPLGSVERLSIGFNF
ncbi:MAG: PorV/PorQ family protein [Candidatus Marinimicrobia bacterium]|nr:PorV/PorQ family protein [Candidatus Neomarinimicrobiota bacterium]|tara:strand:+ start:6765 stop:7790 length:1026 start_codon:yes stop_codon:yes gene_type:complete